MIPGVAVVDRKSAIDSGNPEGLEPAVVKGAVSLRNVTFCYPTRPDICVFKNFSLEIPAGTITALVGESGSGKSTIVNLVERFYDVTTGAVRCPHLPTLLTPQILCITNVYY